MTQDPKNPKNDRGRREFLRKSSLALGLFVGDGLVHAQEIKPKPKAKPAEPEKPANPVSCAVIGLGNQGRDIIRALAALPGADIKVLCDSYPGIHGRAKERAPKAATVDNYRKVLDHKSVQAVWVATPTHQ